MCFYKYEMSGRTVLNNVICVEWLKIGNCANFEVRHKIVVTDNLLSRHGWFYSLILQEKLCHEKSTHEHQKICQDISYFVTT